jgi:hypothetical protein
MTALCVTKLLSQFQVVVCMHATKNHIKLESFGHAGADVMITIFGEKIGVFLKNQCYDQNFA